MRTANSAAHRQKNVQGTTYKLYEKQTENPDDIPNIFLNLLRLEPRGHTDDQHVKEFSRENKS